MLGYATWLHNAPPEPCHKPSDELSAFVQPRCVTAGSRIAGGMHNPAIPVDVEHNGCGDRRRLGLELVTPPGEFLPDALVNTVADCQRAGLLEGLRAIGVGIE